MKFLYSLIFILIGGNFLFGGLGINDNITILLGFCLSISLLLFVYLKKGSIEIPREFKIYALFLLFLMLSIIWDQNSGEVGKNFALFLNGGLFFIGFSNLERTSVKIFTKILIILGITYGLLYLIESITSSDLPRKSFTLYLPQTDVHNHLGDIWAIIILTLGYQLVTHRKWWQIPLILLGIYFLLVSMSRSAYLALFGGAVYLFYKLKWFDQHKQIFVVLLVLITALFLYAGFFKTTIFSRPYFRQAYYGIIEYPFGVGIGNFYKISAGRELVGQEGPNISSYAHNIVLEVLTGLGIFGVVFAIWLTLVIKRLLLAKQSPDNTLAGAIFLAITINFFFDFTYVIPTMLWLWFCFLGLAEIKPDKNSES